MVWHGMNLGWDGSARVSRAGVAAGDTRGGPGGATAPTGAVVAHRGRRGHGHAARSHYPEQIHAARRPNVDRIEGDNVRALDNVSIWRILVDRADERSDDDFLIYDTGHGEPISTLSYGGALAAVERLASGLATLGVGAGDRVVLRLGNSDEFVLVLLALVRLGAVPVPVIRNCSAAELGYIIDHSESRCLIMEPDDDAGGPFDLPSEMMVILSTPRGTVSGRGDDRAQVRDLLETSPGPLPAPPSGTGDALIFYTSGTTSRPKGVVLSHEACLAAGLGSASAWQLVPDDRLYVVLPLFHSNAMFFQFFPALLTGAAMLLAPRFSARGYWRTVVDQDITVGNLTAGAVRSLLAQPPSTLDTVHRMKMMSFALPLNEEEIRAFSDRFGVPLYMGYGLTESAASGTRTPFYMARRGLWQSIGRPQPDWEIRIIDDEGGPLLPDRVGEILIKGPGMMTRYLKNPEATSEALRDGWLYTGDLGRIDADGYVHFVSRKKDMLKPKGENVAASEIESVLDAHPSIRESAVIGVFDAHHDERIVAFVVADEGAGAITSEELREHCRCSLADYKVPSEIVFLDDLPKTSIGKIQKSLLPKDHYSSV